MSDNQIILLDNEKVLIINDALRLYRSFLDVCVSDSRNGASTKAKIADDYKNLDLAFRSIEKKSSSFTLDELNIILKSLKQHGHELEAIYPKEIVFELILLFINSSKASKISFEYR